MGDKSKIEWTDASWTPIRARNKTTGKVGWHCEHATPGCEFCYSETLNKRLGTGLPFKPGHRKNIEIFLDKRMLVQPLKWKRPRMIFVCSMTDLFADFVPNEWIDQVFAVMALCPQHTFQVLTKRAERMRDYFAALVCKGGFRPYVRRPGWAARDPRDEDRVLLLSEGQSWPLPNVWLGVSAEDQKRADERIPDLLQTPAAVRFISAEPVLGPINLNKVSLGGADVEFCVDPRIKRAEFFMDALRGVNKGAIPALDWIIVGGESGPNARPMHPDWARSIRDQCQAVGVPFFFKQWGEHVTGYLDGEDFHVDEEAHGPSVTWNGTARCLDIPGESGHYGRVGKRAAGRLLDGREHNEMPERVS